MKSGIFIAIQLLITACFAQQYSYRQYTIFDGLPQNQITLVSQRSDGIFFFSTKSEMGGFDGNRFRQFNDKYLSESNIEGFLRVDKRIYWYTQKALVMFENKKSYLIASFDSVRVHNIKLNHRYKEAYVVSDSAFRVFKPGLKTKHYKLKSLGLLGEVMRIPASSDFLITSSNGIYRLNCKNELKKLLSGHGHKIIAIRNKLYFFSIRGESQNLDFGGLYSYDGAKLQKIHAFGNSVPGGVLTKTENNQIIIVQNNSTWIRIDTLGRIVDKDSIPDMILTDIIEDHDGNLMIGSENGLLHLQSAAFRNYDWKSRMPKYVWSIFEDKDSTLVFASYHGRLFQMKKNILSEVEGYRDLMDPSEVFYMGGFCNSIGQWMIPTNYRIFIYDHGQMSFLPLLHHGNFSTCLATYEDTIAHKVYFGTTNGLFIYHLLTKELKQIDTENKLVLDIEEDKEGRLWLCTGKKVLLLKNDTFVQFGKQEIPVNTGVISCCRDALGNMWYAAKEGLYLHTYKRTTKIRNGKYFFISLWQNKKIITGGVEGIVVVDLEKFYSGKISALQIYDRFNGFNGIECGQNGTCIDSRGHVWIPASESVVKFQPEKFVYDTIPPMPFVVSFEYSLKDLVWTDLNIPHHLNDTVYELQPGQSNVRITYDGLDYTCRERIKFRYRLVGYSNIWKETTGHDAVFTNLSAGTYHFELMAANENGIWTKVPMRIDFRIKPTVVQTLVFKILFVALLALIVAFCVYIIMRSKRRREQKQLVVQRQLIEMQVSTINAQLDPHFIFNAIAAIGSEVQEKNTDKAYAYFVKVSQLLRNSITDTGKIIRSLNDEIQFVQNYLSLQKFRFEDRFEYSVDVDVSVDVSRMVPKMCLQIFVENAMKHGIEHLSDDGRLRVEISEDAQGLHFIIEDNGIGRKASAEISTHSTGVGLQVFSDFFEIMNHYNADKAGFKIEDLFSSDGLSSGTRVEMFIPSTYQYTIQ